MDHAPLQYDMNPDTGLKKPFFPIVWYSFGPLRLDQVKEVSETGVNSIFFADCGRAVSEPSGLAGVEDGG